MVRPCRHARGRQGRAPRGAYFFFFLAAFFFATVSPPPPHPASWPHAKEPTRTCQGQNSTCGGYRPTDYLDVGGQRQASGDRTEERPGRAGALPSVRGGEPRSAPAEPG